MRGEEESWWAAWAGAELLHWAHSVQDWHIYVVVVSRSGGRGGAVADSTWVKAWCPRLASVEVVTRMPCLPVLSG